MQYSFGDNVRGLEDLSPSQQKAFVAMFQDEKFLLKLSEREGLQLQEAASADAEVWAKVRADYPDLVDLTDDDLERTCKKYTSVKPTIADTLFRTPVGPVLLLNLVAFATGFAPACDLPWSATDSPGCVELAARRAAS
jgi:hypothetical protein